MPPDIGKLNKEINAMLAIRSRFAFATPPAEFGKLIADNTEKMGGR